PGAVPGVWPPLDAPFVVEGVEGAPPVFPVTAPPVFPLAAAPLLAAGAEPPEAPPDELAPEDEPLEEDLLEDEPAELELAPDPPAEAFVESVLPRTDGSSTI